MSHMFDSQFVSLFVATDDLLEIMAEFPNYPGSEMFSYNEQLPKKMLPHDEHIPRKILAHDEQIPMQENVTT